MKMQMIQMELFPAGTGEVSHRERTAIKARRRRERREEARAMLGMDGRGRHANSPAAYDEDGQRILNARQVQVYLWILEYGRATDREVRDGLYPGGDMNMVRPRISELLDYGELVETGNVRCRKTGRMVRQVDITGRME